MKSATTYGNQQRQEVHGVSMIVMLLIALILVLVSSTAYTVEDDSETVSQDFLQTPHLTAKKRLDIRYSKLKGILANAGRGTICLLYTSPSPRDLSTSRMPSSA